MHTYVCIYMDFESCCRICRRSGNGTLVKKFSVEDWTAHSSEVCTEQLCSLLCFLCLISILFYFFFFWLLHLGVICRGQDTGCNSSTASRVATVSLKAESEICVITINSNIQVLQSSLIRVSQSILQMEKAWKNFCWWRKQLQSRISPRSLGNRCGNHHLWMLNFCGCQAQHTMARNPVGRSVQRALNGNQHHFQ